MENKISTENLDSYIAVFNKTKEELKDLENKIEKEQRKIEEEQDNFRKRILSGETTGDLFKDWAIVSSVISYREITGLIDGLKAYLSGKDLVLVTEDWKEERGVLHLDCGEIPNYKTYTKTWVGYLSSEGLRVERRPYLDLRRPYVPKLNIPTPLTMDRLRAWSSQETKRRDYEEKIAQAKAQPLILVIATQDSSKIYFEQRREYSFYEHEKLWQKFEEGITLPYLNPQIIPALRNENGTLRAEVKILDPAYLGIEERPDELTRVRIAAGKEAVLEQLQQITKNNKVKEANNLQSIYEALKSKPLPTIFPCYTQLTK